MLVYFDGIRNNQRIQNAQKELLGGIKNNAKPRPHIKKLICDITCPEQTFGYWKRGQEIYYPPPAFFLRIFANCVRNVSTIYSKVKKKEVRH
eukprot:UN00245